MVVPVLIPQHCLQRGLPLATGAAGGAQSGPANKVAAPAARAPTREDDVTDGKDPASQNRRDIFRAAAAGAALLGLGITPAMAAEMSHETGRSQKKLKAAFSNAGLQATWCAQGKQAAEAWGRLYNVDVT